MFSGSSSSVASIVHAVGTLARRKTTGLLGSSTSNDEVVRAFECDVDGLELRLRRHAAILARHCDGESSKLTSANNNPLESCQSNCLTRHPDLLNEAVFWCAWTILFTDIRCRSEPTDPDLTTLCERILDCCAEVPRDSHTAPLMLFPLMIGGLRSTKKLHREFVLGRLEKLDNIGLSDTRALRRDLTEHWRTPEPLADDSPATFTHFVF